MLDMKKYKSEKKHSQDSSPLIEEKGPPMFHPMVAYTAQPLRLQFSPHLLLLYPLVLASLHGPSGPLPQE